MAVKIITFLRPGFLKGRRRDAEFRKRKRASSCFSSQHALSLQDRMKRIVNIFRLIVSPKATWGTLMNGASSSVFEKAMYYPLLAILAITAFVKMLYDNSLTLSMAVMDAINSYISYFLGYIICAFIVSLSLPKIQEADKRVSDGRVKVFVMYNMSFLVILDIVQNFLPADFIFLHVFPLYLLVLISSGMSFFHIDKSKNAIFVLGVFLLVVLMPVVINMLLSKMLGI